MNKRQQIKKVKQVWQQIQHTIYNTSNEYYLKKLFKVSMKESKDHDLLRDGERGISVHEEATLFATKRICEYLYDLGAKPNLEAFLHTQKSVYYAYALAKLHACDLMEVISKEDVRLIGSFDYSELIKPEE